MIKKLFLIKATVEETFYMENTVSREDIRCVWAIDAEDAVDEYYNYWNNQESSYSVSYVITRLNVTETLGRRTLRLKRHD